MNRRRFLKLSVGGTLLLGAAGVVGRHLTGYSLEPELANRLRVLSPKEFIILRAAAARIAAPDQPDAPLAGELNTTLFVDEFLTSFAPPLQSDVKNLLHLLEHGSGLSRFSRMSPAEQDRTLNEWQDSQLAVRRQGLHALRSLTFMGYYRQPRTWPMLSYTGPVRR